MKSDFCIHSVDDKGSFALQRYFIPSTWLVDVALFNWTRLWALKISKQSFSSKTSPPLGTLLSVSVGKWSLRSFGVDVTASCVSRQMWASIEQLWTFHVLPLACNASTPYAVMSLPAQKQKCPWWTFARSALDWQLWLTAMIFDRLPISNGFVSFVLSKRPKLLCHHNLDKVWVKSRRTRKQVSFLVW